MDSVPSTIVYTLIAGIRKQTVRHQWKGGTRKDPSGILARRRNRLASPGLMPSADRPDVQGDVTPRSPKGNPGLWMVVLAVSTPFLATLCVILWRTPFPVSEAVAIFEDVANRRPLDVFRPESAYYRPPFYLTLSAIWFNVTSLEAKLTWIRLVQIVPVCVLVVAFLRHLRPRSSVGAADTAALLRRLHSDESRSVCGDARAGVSPLVAFASTAR